MLRKHPGLSFAIDFLNLSLLILAGQPRHDLLEGSLPRFILRECQVGKASLILKEGDWRACNSSTDLTGWHKSVLLLKGSHNGVACHTNFSRNDSGMNQSSVIQDKRIGGAMRPVD
jgi:hypothetical protein